MKPWQSSVLLTSVLILSTVTISGCAVTTAGVKPGDERNFVRSVRDVAAGRAIKARMKRAEGFKLGGVNVDVAEGIVLLAGNVQRPEDKIEAERIAWSAPNIVKVGNEILLKEKQSVIRNTKDGILQQAVRTRLTADNHVKARNIRLEVHDGIVYLLGVARTPQELERAAHIASTTKGTREVVSYVKVFGDSAMLVNANSQSSYGSPSYGQSYSEQSYSGAGAIPYSPPMTEQPSYRPLPEGLSTAPSVPQTLPPAAPSTSVPRAPDALPDTEPYYVDPVTKERIELPPGVVPIPYMPDTGPGSLGAGALPPPGGSNEPFYVDPQSGTRIPVVFLSNGTYVIESKYLTYMK